MAIHHIPIAADLHRLRRAIRDPAGKTERRASRDRRAQRRRAQRAVRRRNQRARIDVCRPRVVIGKPKHHRARTTLRDPESSRDLCRADRQRISHCRRRIHNAVAQQRHPASQCRRADPCQRASIECHGLGHGDVAVEFQRRPGRHCRPRCRCAQRTVGRHRQRAQTHDGRSCVVIRVVRENQPAHTILLETAVAGLETCADRYIAPARTGDNGEVLAGTRGDGGDRGGATDGEQAGAGVRPRLVAAKNDVAADRMRHSVAGFHDDADASSIKSCICIHRQVIPGNRGGIRSASAGTAIGEAVDREVLAECRG